MLRSIFFCIVFILSCALAPTAVTGQVVLNNKSAEVADNNKAGYNGGSGSAEKAAQAFTTGTALTNRPISVDLVMTTAEGTPAANFTVKICGATGALPDEGNILATLSGNSNPAGAGTYTYTGTVTWAAGQNLFIVCSANTLTGAYLWITTLDAPITTSNAYTAPYRLHTTTSSSWGYGDDFRHLFSLTVLAALPVELLDFTSKNTEGGNLLTWTTANEINNKGFQVERLDGNTWEVLGFKAANNKAGTYQFTDDAPHSTSYYRLRQIDNDGTETLSKVISIQNTPSGGRRIKAYPNPVSNTLTVENTEGGNFQILNLLGQQVLSGKTAQRIDVSALPQGAYFLKVGTEQVKFVKQ